MEIPDIKVKVRDVLLVSAYVTLDGGYRPVSAGAESTKARVLGILLPGGVPRACVELDPAIEACQARAELAVKWIRKEPESEWSRSVVGALSHKEVPPSMVGVIASLFSGYDRAERRASERAMLQRSEWQGTPGEPIQFEYTGARLIAQGKSKFTDAPYYLIQFLDSQGNVYLWFSPKDYSAEVSGAKGHTVKGVVKSHGERERVKQTVIQVKELL